MLSKKDTWLFANRPVRYVALLLALLCVFVFAQTGTAIEVRRVELLESSQAEVPPDTAAWRPFVLPYQKPLDQLDAGYAWFRITLPPPQSPVAQGLYVNNHMYGIKVWLNGAEVGGSEAPPGKQATGWNLPLLMRLPEGAWHDGDNVMMVRLELHRFTNVLASVYVGPYDDLWPLWQARHFTQGHLSQLSFYLCLVMGLFMLGLWSQRRHDTQYLWFGLSALCWAVPMLYMAVTYAPIRHDWFLVLTLVAINAYGITSIRCLHRLLQLHHPRIEALHLASVGLISLMEAVAPASMIMPLSLLADTIALLTLLNVLRLSLPLAFRQGHAEARLVMAMAAVALVLFSRDVYEFLSATRSNTMIGSGTYMQYAFPLILLVFFVILIRRFVSALQDSEQLNRELEQRVAAIDAQLQASYAANRAWELKEATESQKQKIYRDLHDDVGARLVSIMHARESTEQSRLAQSALASLRETVSSGNFQDEKLFDLLTDAGHNIEARCHNSDLSFQTPQLEAVPEVTFSGNHCYHLKRILQEVVSNIIKHAGATEVAMAVAVEAGTLVVTLTDDGVGISSAAVAGNGMTNIRYRAREIGAEVAWLAGPDGRGCSFRLWLSLPG